MTAVAGDLLPWVVLAAVVAAVDVVIAEEGRRVPVRVTLLQRADAATARDSPRRPL